MTHSARRFQSSDREDLALTLLPGQQTYPHSIPLGAIQLPAHQPRRYFDPIALQKLTQSIAQYGILEPLLVRPIAGDRYELVAGERRYRAARQAGLRDVPVVVRPLSDRDALRIALLENLQREDLNPVEETEGILQLLSIELQQPIETIPTLLHRLRNEAQGKTAHNVMSSADGQAVQAVFESIGSMSWESFVTNRLPLLKLPVSILQALQEGQLAYTKALAIAKVRSSEQRDQLLAEAIAQNLSLSEIRSRIAQLRDSQKPATPIVPSLRDRWSQTYQRLKQSGVLDNPQKRQQVEALIEQLAALADNAQSDAQSSESDIPEASAVNFHE
jgi:ParB family chromosome partitioning protein